MATPKRQRAPSFRRLEDSTPADWKKISDAYGTKASHVADRVLAHMRLLRGDYSGFPIDRLNHSLQTATLAADDGRDEEYVVCALLHDIGDVLAPYNHSDVAADILRTFVSEENHWMVLHHGIFQAYYYFHHVGGDRNLRAQFKGHLYYERTDEFCVKYDNAAFDPDRLSMSLKDLEPAVHRVLAAPRTGMYSFLNKS